MRNVSILSFSFAAGEGRPDLDEDGILTLIRDNLSGTEDVVLLPETCLGTKLSEPGDRFLTGIAGLAASRKVYILASVNRKLTGDTHANSAILYDRRGEVAFCYDKLYPYWGEFDRTDSTVIPGSRAVCADTDFGKVSAAICFDANFPEVWEEIAGLGADLVLFSSAYSAGRQLMAHALNHHYAIVTATWKPDFAVYDVDGRELTYNRADPSQTLISRARVDLDKVICHHNFNRDKLERLLKEHPGTLELQHDYNREEWCVIRALSPDISARKLCGDYAVESLRAYKRRSKTGVREGSSKR
jgi:predicted amidohydrolase